MKRAFHGFILVVAFCLLAPAQTTQIPPDIQAIRTKAQAGQKLTTQEEARYKDWLKSRISNRSGQGALASVPSGAGGDICPPPRATPVATAAPSQDEFLLLVQTLMADYGNKLGSARSGIDRSLAPAAMATSGANLGASLLMSGAPAAAVYSTAVAVFRNPLDWLAINNLGAALQNIPDYGSSAKVLLYAARMQPDAVLPALNLGWAYYHAGDTVSAKRHFEAALGLQPGVAGAEGGLGMLASCRGDFVQAEKYLQASLGKKYSFPMARALSAARSARQKASQPAPPGNMPPSVPPPPPGAQGPEIPELPVVDDPGKTHAARPGFRKVLNAYEARLRDLLAREQELRDRVAAINRRVGGDPDKGLVLARVFDKEIFLIGEIALMTIGPPMQPVLPIMNGSADVVQRAGNQSLGVLKPDLDRTLEILREKSDLMHKIIACPPQPAAAHAACEAPLEARIKTLDAEARQIDFRACKQALGLFSTTYAQNYKVWKAYSDGARQGTRDFYLFSQPVLDRIYVPALHDLIEVGRERQAVSHQLYLAQYADSLASIAGGLKDLKCVEPPREDPQDSSEADLPKKKAEPCPLESGIKIAIPGFQLELDCEKVKVEAGEGLIGSIERNFKKKETTFWVGAGVKLAEADPSYAPKVFVEGKAGFGVSVRDNPDGSRSVEDVFISSSLKVGTATKNIEMGTKVGVESGLQFGRGVAP